LSYEFSRALASCEGDLAGGGCFARAEAQTMQFVVGDHQGWNLPVINKLDLAIGGY